MRNDLTKRQKECLEALTNFVLEHGYPPSYRDLCEVLNVKSPSTISDFLHKLKGKGYIDWLEGQPRTLRIIKTAS